MFPENPKLFSVIVEVEDPLARKLLGDGDVAEIVKSAETPTTTVTE